MNIKKKLETLLTYYQATRAKGHSTLLKNGTENNAGGEFFILVHKMDCPVYDAYDINEKVSLYNLDKLRGHNKPLAIDNAALLELFSESLMKIEALEEENKKLRKQNKLILVTPGDKLWKKVEDLENLANNLRKQGKTPLIGKNRR